MAPMEREAMDAETFESIVVEALDSLPPEFARYLDNVEIQIEQRPTRAQRRELGLKPWQTLYGLYQGVPLTERSGGSPLMPDVITLFQEPLERDFLGREQLRAQVRRTLLHEIAHFFGISDARLRELDAY
jgi:predicted Zn-dependent protease with MMP-like domain